MNTPALSTAERSRLGESRIESGVLARSSNRELRVEATSSNSTATLTVYVTSSGATIGTLSNSGGGRYGAQFANIATNPVNITVKSNKGGSATRAVTANYRGAGP